MDDVDSENSVCMTWSIDPSGTMRHRKTGTKVSTKEGITCRGSRQQKDKKKTWLISIVHVNV